ncbi:endo-1,4-beta-xylanase [Verrucomicrobiaceae bacterium N1E253]|uniref:endo-1,4-beta-xylanase n=1 Tax=Oceaniferula marina TaxID=2748318 RepID=A0A851GHV1_9BACT|nr:endo-1,4-beta-xylanase [Oceaniferula marina]NWK54805.1 endo-1,4-beta-xylanase [Oceaniferula marina]
MKTNRSFLVCLGFGCVAGAASLSAAEMPVPDGERLRTLVRKHFPEGHVYIGGTTGWAKLERGSGTVLDREFSYVTPENDFKQQMINPRPGVWNWKHADAWVKRCAERQQVLRLHGPISPQVSRWAKEDQRTAEELSQCLDEFMTRLCQRYDRYDHVKWIDVVNEAVSTDGSWFGPKPGVDKWENPWPKMGYDDSDPLRPPLYIKRAFLLADKHAPKTKLIINQHGSMEKAMWEKVKSTVLYLRKQGLRVDGIGWQAHVDVGWEKQPGNVEALHELIRWSHANGLSFHVTENNVWLKKDKDYQAQAATFGAILRILLEHRASGVVTWNVWNLSDGEAWIRNRAYEGCLFDDQFAAKPAYYSIQRELLQAAKTSPSK